MGSRWRAYLGIVKASASEVSHFRANLIAWILYSPLQLGILYLVWGIVYRKTDAVGSFGFRDMMLYYLVVHFLRRLFEPLMTINFEVWKEINEGRLDVYLARPIHYATFTFCRSLGAPLVEVLVGVPFFLIFAWALGVPVATDPAVLALFAASAAAGYVILFFVQFLIGSLTFWMERIFGVRDLVFSVFLLFSGQMIPISVLPEWVARISAYLPFESIFFVPARIYGEAHAVDAGGGLFRQLVWVLALWALATAVWSRGVDRYASQGG